MAKPVSGETMQAYCDCANKKRDESNPVVSSPVQTTWVCKSKYKDSVSSGIFSSVARFLYFWECLNCGKKRNIGIWDANGASYGGE